MTSLALDQASTAHIGTSEAWAMFGNSGPESRWRYALGRTWDVTRPPLLATMLNPSTATHEVLDPTITRVVGFARRWGHGGIVILNLFAYRATDPAVVRRLLAVGDTAIAVGPFNDSVLSSYLGRGQERRVLCGWGAAPWAQARAAAFRYLARDAGASLVCVKRTKGGAPQHPLYVRADAPAVSWP